MELWAVYIPVLAFVAFPSTAMVADRHKGTQSIKCTIYGNFSRVPKKMAKRNYCQKQGLRRESRSWRILFLTAAVKQPALLKAAFPINNPMKERVCVWGGVVFLSIRFWFFLSCRVKTFKPVFIPSCFWHASFAIILDPITPTSSSSSSSSSIPDWIPLESTPLGSSYETHLCSLWPHMTRFSWPPRRADADGTSTL